ncbi:MAG: hypothetical protein ABGW90_04770, partial [Martelella sp.]
DSRLPEDVAPRCEACDAEIVDLYAYDTLNGVVMCPACAPTWQDFKDNPESFYHLQNGEPVHYTAKTAAPVIAAYLASGGKLTDTKVPLRSIKKGRTDE